MKITSKIYIQNKDAYTYLNQMIIDNLKKIDFKTYPQQYMFTQNPLVIYSKHPILPNVYCVFEKLADYKEIEQRPWEESFTQYSSSDVNQKYLKENDNLAMAKVLVKHNGFRNFPRWYSSTWFNQPSSVYNPRKYWDKNFTQYMVYMVLLNKEEMTDNEKILDWLNTPYIDVRRMIIHMLVSVKNDTKIAIHFYISNHTNGPTLYSKTILGDTVQLPENYKK